MVHIHNLSEVTGESAEGTSQAGYEIGCGRGLGTAFGPLRKRELIAEYYRTLIFD